MTQTIEVISKESKKTYNLLEKSNDIIKVLFFVDLALFVFGLFKVSKTSYLIVVTINILFIGSYLIIKKFSYMFEPMIQMQKATSGLNNILNKLNG